MRYKNFLRAILDNKFPKIAQFYRTIRDQFDRFRPSIQTPWGFSLAGDTTMASGSFEPDETKLIRQILQGKDIDVFVNVGANIGYYCCHALSLGKKVIAIEPIPRNLYYLMMNFITNGWTENIEIFPVALASKSTVMKIYGGGTGASLVRGWAKTHESYFTFTPTLTLDRIAGDSLNGKKALILIDVEGFEYNVLQGASVILKNIPPPIWIVEISLKEHQPSGINKNPYFIKTFEIFFNAGYKCFTADSECTHVDFLTVKAAYEGKIGLKTHNFLFQHV